MHRIVHMLTILLLAGLALTMALWARSLLVCDVVVCEEPGPSPYRVRGVWTAKGRLVFYDDISGARWLDPAIDQPAPTKRVWTWDRREAQSHEPARIARRSLWNLLVIRPIDSSAHFNLANLLAATDRLDEAIDHYQQAVKINARDPRILNNLGIALARRGNREQAIQTLRQAIAFDPAYADAHANLGAVLMEQGDKPGARAAFEQALRLNPDSAVARRGIQRLASD